MPTFDAGENIFSCHFHFSGQLEFKIVRSYSLVVSRNHISIKGFEVGSVKIDIVGVRDLDWIFND